MGVADAASPRPWLEVGAATTSDTAPTLTVSSYLASRLGSRDWLPPLPLDDAPLAIGSDEGLGEPEAVDPPTNYFSLERQGVGSAVRAVLGAARADPALAAHLHRPLPLGRRPTILLDLAANIVTATERASARAAAPMSVVLNQAVDALGTADGYTEASAIRQHRRRWLAGGLLVAAAAAGEADARWLELGFLAEAAPRLASSARAWQVARMPSRADALIDVVLALPSRLDRLTGSAPSREAAVALVDYATEGIRASLGVDDGGPARHVELAGDTTAERRHRLLALADSVSRRLGAP